ncbi:2-hydroxycarboxylate transporter family protein [Methylobacterium oryzae CBMB20]
MTLYLLGVMAHHLVGLPAPVAMLFLAVLAKLASAVSPHLQAGGFVVYEFVQVSMTYPLLFAIGVAAHPLARADGRLHAGEPDHDRVDRRRR